MNLRWSDRATADLISIRAHVSLENPAAARSIVRTIIELVEGQLPRFPQLGRPGRIAGTLELVMPRLPYIVPYRVTSDEIVVLRVYHAARRWPDQL